MDINANMIRIVVVAPVTFQQRTATDVRAATKSATVRVRPWSENPIVSGSTFQVAIPNPVVSLSAGV